MKDLLTNFPFDQLGVWATIIVIFTYNVLLGRAMTCTCKQHLRVCSLYIAMPTFTVFFLMLWVDKKVQRVCRHLCCSLCGGMCCRLFSVLSSRIIKAFFISLLWVVTVLIDGDWWVCCQNNELSCNTTKILTPEEKETIAELKNTSKTIGFSLLLAIIFLAAPMSCCPWRKCCCGKKCLYDKLILEEEKIVLKEILTTAAKEKLNEAFIVKIGDKKWEDCFKVTDELMKCDKPALSKKQKQLFDKLKATATGQSATGATGESTPVSTAGATSRSNRSDEQDDQQPQMPYGSQSSAEHIPLEVIGSSAAAPQEPEDAGEGSSQRESGGRPETERLLGSNNDPSIQ